MENINLKKECSYCGEQIDQEVGRCPFCGSLVEKSMDMGIDKNETDDITSLNHDIPQNFNKSENNFNNSHSSTNQLSGQPEVLKNKLSNGLKVLLTVLSVTVPFIGQIAGIIIAIVYMNTNYDEDRKSFGTALLIASVVFFVLSVFGIIIIGMTALLINGVPY